MCGVFGGKGDERSLTVAVPEGCGVVWGVVSIFHLWLVGWPITFRRI